MESGEYAELCTHQNSNSGQTWIPIHDCPLSESTCKLLNRVVPNGTLRGVEGESQISPIRSSDKKGSVSDGILAIVYRRGMSFGTFPVIDSDEDTEIKRLTGKMLHVHKLQKKGVFLCVK